MFAREVLMHTITDAIKISSLGRTTLYEAIGAKKLDARKCGNRTLITADSLRSFVENLPAAEIRTGQKKTTA